MGRAADFFGPGVLNSTLGGAFFPAILTGQPALAMGNIDLPHSYSHIADVARGLAALGETSRGDGRVWHLPTVPAVSTAAIHRMVETLAGHAFDVDLLTEPKPYGPFDQQFMNEYAEMFYQHLIPQNMVSTAFEDAFGLHPTPLREALGTTLDWYRKIMVTQ
jgi:nucleoside-diphosphate-sugar epimerase